MCKKQLVSARLAAGRVKLVADCSVLEAMNQVDGACLDLNLCMVM